MLCIGLWFYLLTFYSAFILIGGVIVLLIYHLRKQLHFYFLLLLTLVMIGRTFTLFFTDQMHPKYFAQSVSFSQLERITDIKQSNTSQSFIGVLNQKRYIVFAPSHFQIGIFCNGEGDFQPLDYQSTLRYYFLAQQLTERIVIKTLQCHSPPFFTIQYFRDFLHNQFLRYQDTGEFYFMLLFGGGSNTPLIDTQTWQSVGVIHLLSLSGLQITLLFSYFRRIYYFFPCGESMQKVINSVILICYGILCYNSLPFLRIIGIKLWEEWGGHQRRFFIQSVTAYTFLLIWPECYYNIGFWFSLLMQCALIFNDIFKSKYHIAPVLRFVITACILFLITLIISMAFHLPVAPLFLLTNMLFIPLFEYLVLPIVLIGLLLLPMQHPVVFALSTLNILLNTSLYYIQNCFVYTYEATFALWAYIIHLFLIIRHKNKKYILANVFISISLLMSSLIFIPRTTHTTLIFLDVGQGDSSIIFIAQSQTLIVVDTGAPNSTYLTKLKKYLYQLGKTHIDYLIITHADSDHSGNAKAVLLDREIQPQTLILPRTKKSDALSTLEKTHQNQTLYVDKNSTLLPQMTILNPGYQLADENEESIVFQLTIGNHTFFYQADAGLEFEQANQFQLSKVTLLKVSHHGSKGGSSDSFLHLVQPQYSIISAGKNNRYGHPHQEVITRLNSIKSIVLQTKEQGDIKLQCTEINCYQSD